MNSHDRLNIVFAEARQFWRAFAYVMQLHQKCPTKRAGEAGIALRAEDTNIQVGAELAAGKNFSMQVSCPLKTPI